VAPRRIDFPTRPARGASTPDVLPIGYANDNLVLGDPNDLLARSSHVGNVLKHFGAKHAIERIGGKFEVCYVSRNSHNSGELEGGFLEV
jgi:hypothetical protein